jgi:hypothetical protein
MGRRWLLDLPQTDSRSLRAKPRWLNSKLAGLLRKTRPELFGA